MAFDAHKNLAVSTVATAPTPATSGTSLTVAGGEGQRFPAPPFNATIWPANAAPTPANAEVVRVTARATDTLTIARAQEGSTARLVGVGDLIAQTITAKTLTDLETQAALLGAANVFTQPQTITQTGVNSRLTLIDPSHPANLRGWAVLNYDQRLQIQPVNDAGVATLNAILLERNGNVRAHQDLYEKFRSTALGHWITEPYNPANFSGGAPLTWSVAAGAVTTNRYTLIGKTLVWSLAIDAATLGGAPGPILRATIPGGCTSAASMLGGTGFGNVAGGWLPLMIQIQAGLTYVSIFRHDVANYALGSVYIQFTLTLEIP